MDECTHEGRNSCSQVKFIREDFREMSFESSYERGKSMRWQRGLCGQVRGDRPLVPVGLDTSNQMLTPNGHLLRERKTWGAVGSPTKTQA